MYKETIIICVLIVLIVVFNIITQNYTKESVKAISEELNEVKGLIKIEDEKMKEQVDLVMENWKQRKDILEYYIEHEELEKVETELTTLKANVEIEEYAQAVPDIDRCIFILEHIKEKFTLKIQNIF